jgi:antitoxin component of MazEF toxin-antitoxin module
MITATLRKSGGSITVTIPPSYLKDVGLTAGSMVALDIQGDKLTISPAHKKVTLADIIAAAPARASKLRSPAWDELLPVGDEV